MTQFYSRNDVNFTGDVYSIPFSYIKKDEIKVYIDDELWTDWHFLNESQLTLDSVPKDIGYNNIISVRRETDIAEKVVDYSNNSLLNKENLNKSQDQLLYAVQEIYDNNTQFEIDITDYNEQFATDIRAEVDEKVERVTGAVEQLEKLEDAVETAITSAAVATQQAGISTDKAEETLNTYNEAMAEIDTLRQNSIKDIDQLVADYTNDLNSLDATIKKDADAIINRVGLTMFDTVLKDHILTYEETRGLALQGTFVYKDAIAGERYGYPDFINKCIEEKEAGVATQVTLGSSTITMYVNSNGHQFYDIADKGTVDTWFNTYGIADFYGVDTENECVFLPRNNYFMQLTGDITKVNKFNAAGLPTLTTNSTGAHTHTRGTMDIKGTATAIEDSCGVARNTGVFTGAFYNSKTLSQAFSVSSGGDGATLAFQASRNWTGATSSNGAHTHTIAGTSDTVQPPSSNKLLYYCVGNTVSDTFWIDAVTQVQEGAKDLEDKKNICIDEINATAKSYDNLTYRNITNCLLEIPQRIKYDLTDGTLTVKAGTVVIVPYGTEDKTSELPVGSTFLNENFKVYDTQYTEDADGNGKFFVWAEVVSDIVASPTATGTLTRFTTLNLTTNIVSSVIQTESGAATNTQSYTYNYTGYYNTSTNLVGYTNNSTTITYSDVRSLPFMSVVADGTYMYASISQVFNGFGYIGSTVWGDKGVKSLAPNGRNEDGTYNNIERISNDINVFTVPTTETGEFYLAFGVYGQLTYLSPNRWSYNDKLNSIDINGSPRYGLSFAGMFTATNGVISNFNPKQPFRITDNAVSKSGDTMSGPLVINTNKDDQLRNLILRFSSTDFAIPPSSAIYPNLEFQDGQGRRMGRVEYTYKPDGSHYISINDKKNDNTASYALLYVGYDANGNAISSAPACAAINSIVTTTGIKKAANGYVKLGNGIIIQWGRFTSVSKTNTTISFPTAFSSTNYGVVLFETSAGAQDEWANACWVVSKAKGSFVYKTSLNEKPAYDWVAIGY